MNAPSGRKAVAHQASNVARRQGAPSCDCAVYDGRTRLGGVRGCASEGFDALGVDGSHIGHFRTIKDAAHAVSLMAGGAA